MTKSPAPSPARPTISRLLVALAILLLPGPAFGQQAELPVPEQQEAGLQGTERQASEQQESEQPESEQRETREQDPAAAPGLTPRWELAEQTTLQLTLRQTTDTITTLEPRTYRMRLESVFTFGWLVESVSESGEMSIRQTLESIRLRVIPADGGDTILYDSASSDPLRGPARQLAETVAPLMGTELMFQLTPRGEVVSTSLPEATREALKQLSPSLSPSLSSTPDAPSSEMLEETLASTLVVFPEHPLDVDSSWEQKTSIPAGTGGGQLLRQYTYRGTDLSGLENLESLGGPEVDRSSWHRIDLVGQLESSADKSRSVESEEPGSGRGQDVSGWLLWDADLAGITRGTTTLRQVRQSQFQNRQTTVRLSSLVSWELQRR